MRSTCSEARGLGGFWVIGLIVASSLERLWGAFGGREALQMGPGDLQEKTPDDPNTRPKPSPWSASGMHFGAGPREAGGLKETAQATSKGSPAAEARRFFKTYKNDQH